MHLRLKFLQPSGPRKALYAALCALAALCAACAGRGAIDSSRAAERAAVDLANDQCWKQYGKRPFRTGAFPASLSGERWLWGWLDPAAAQGYSAQVSFRSDRSDAQVSVRYSAEPDKDVEDPNAPSLKSDPVSAAPD